MARRNKIWAIYDISLILTVFTLFFYGMHYAITRIIGASLRLSLFLLSLGFLQLAPIIMWSYMKAYKKYYTDNSQHREIIAITKKRSEKLFLKYFIYSVLFMTPYMLSFLYFTVRSNMFAGAAFAIVAIIMYAFFLRIPKRMVDRMKVP